MFHTILNMKKLTSLKYLDRFTMAGVGDESRRCGSAPSCEDNYGSCGYWARVGYCARTYVAWMRVNCKRSCGVCY